MAEYRRGPSLPARLLAAADWFNESLSTAMEAAGWPFLSRSQSLLFVSIDDDGTRPAELARRVGITRQSMQQLLRKLGDHGLIAIDADPADGRAMIVRLAPRAHLLGRDAAIISARLETELARRIGAETFAQLHAALEADWGQPPFDGRTLRAGPLPEL